MDHQHRGGHKTGSGALASSQDIAIERRERLRRLALETIDLSKDPYFMKNHLGMCNNVIFIFITHLILCFFYNPFRTN